MGESEIARSMCDSVESLVRLAQRLEAANKPPPDGRRHRRRHANDLSQRVSQTASQRVSRGMSR